MKKHILLLLTLVIAVCGVLSAQKSCKPVQDKKDEFTGLESVFWGGTVREDLIGTDMDRTISLHFGKYGDTLLLQITVAFLARKDEVLKVQDQKECLSSKKGNNLFIALENNQRVQLTALADSKMSKRKVLSTLRTEMYINYLMSKADYELMCANKFSKMRLVLDDCAPIEFEVRDNKKESFLKLFNCAKARLFP